MWASANHSLFPSVSPNAAITTEAKLAHNEGKCSLSRLVVRIKTSQTWPSILFFTAIAFVQLLTKQDCRDQRFQFERAGSKMLCVVDYIFNLLCAFNFLRPMKKNCSSIASRATGWFQIKPSGSGDENAYNGCFLSPSFQDQVTSKWWTLGTEWDENDEWYEFNQMKRNHSKYQAITFGRVERNPVLTCEGTVIPIQDEMELLSVTLDNKLKFEGQIRKICRKVSQQVAVLNRLKKILPFELRIDIYRAFIVPHFNYCSESWHHCEKRGCAKLEKINERALCFVTVTSQPRTRRC